MTLPDSDFANLEVQWPAEQWQKECYLRGIPLVFWDRNSTVGRATPLFSRRIDHITLHGRRGEVEYEIWQDLRARFLVIFGAPRPPTVTLSAAFEVEDNVITCELKMLSGEPVAEFSQEVTAEKPFIMGHVNMIAFLAAYDWCWRASINTL
eukprot:Skav200935  [mRNA]  locus=scaffold2433:433149:433601:+ [translate_table: standard]